MKKASWMISIAIIVAISGCQKIAYKPYLPEQYRVDADEPDPTLPGILTGKKGEYVIYGRVGSALDTGFGKPKPVFL